MKIGLEFKPQDCWVGAFWKRLPGYDPEEEPVAEVHVWICLLPMFPLHIQWVKPCDTEKPTEDSTRPLLPPE